MIYTALTNKAMKLAYTAHHGQTDTGGLPYIFHPFHLAEQMTDEITVCVALLHDVVEDTPVTLEELEKEFPKEVTEALRLLTHEEGTDYFDYVRAIRENPVAKAVKLARIPASETRRRETVTKTRGNLPTHRPSGQAVAFSRGVYYNQGEVPARSGTMRKI